MAERTIFNDPRLMFEALQLLNTELPSPDDKEEEESQNQNGQLKEILKACLEIE